MRMKLSDYKKLSKQERSMVPAKERPLSQGCSVVIIACFFLVLIVMIKTCTSDDSTNHKASVPGNHDVVYNSD